MVIGRAAHEAIGFDKDDLNRSMNMSVTTMGPTTDFEQWKRNFLNFLSLKAAYLIPPPAIRESGVWLNEQAQHYAYTLLLHARVALAAHCDHVLWHRRFGHLNMQSM
jgi:hypothetical protein